MSRVVPSMQKSAPTAMDHWNEAVAADGSVREQWRVLYEEIQNWDAEDRSAMAMAAQRQIEELGARFNVFSDVGGAGQPYQIDPIPLILSMVEWTKVSAGLEQRMRLLNYVLADVYGAQKLLSLGMIPPDLIHSNRAFMNHGCGTQMMGENMLHLMGCDMVRGANGAWKVLRDHTVTPGGIGQTMENRHIVSRILIGAFEGLEIAALGNFMDAEREAMRSLSMGKFHGANVVFLTPGFRHPSYFEHAYKAKILGFPLVEAADLTVRERRLYLKTLGGLRRVDVLVCRVDHDQLDPLEQWGGAGEGVAGLIEAWRAGNAVVSNAPGAGFASSLALMPFLPRICRECLGEEMKLPFVETWWLGQKDILDFVHANLQRFILLSVNHRNDGHLPLRWSELSPSSRKQWLKEINARPHDFVVQADVRPSEIPTIENRQLRQRPVMWRGYVMKVGDIAHVMPGGLARIDKGYSSPQMWPKHAGVTKDVWITGQKVPEKTTADFSYVAQSPNLPAAQDVPSRIAEQLFWVGRYAERVEQITRLLRVYLSRIVGETALAHHIEYRACDDLLQSIGLLSADMTMPANQVQGFISSVIHDTNWPMGVRSQISLLMQNAASARDRLSDDTWRFIHRLEDIVHKPRRANRAGELSGTLDNLVLHLAAISGMQAENMTRGQGWRFLEIGRRIERSIYTLTYLDAAKKRTEGIGRLLEALLQTCDSMMTYRRRHFSLPKLPAVVDLLYFDTTNPRSVVHQMRIIHEEISHFPIATDYGLMPKIRDGILALLHQCQRKPSVDLPDFLKIAEEMGDFSDQLSQHFFSHSVRRIY